jgi:NTE family protein
MASGSLTNQCEQINILIALDYNERDPLTGNTILNNSRTPPKVGLVLGSGASRGWSHIGVIKALLREDIEPDIICGTSVGAMIGAAYLAGNLDKLEDWVLGSSRTDVLRFFNLKLSRVGFADTDRLNWFLHNYVAAADVCIENLPKPFAAVSTNLDRGQEVWLLENGLADAVKASMALPGLFPPVRNNGRWLVDGGLVNPVPVTTCHALGADVVIAVNLNSDIIDKSKVNGPESAASQVKGALGNFKQAAREYSNSIFANHDKEADTPRLFFAITHAINIVQDRITRSRLAGDPTDVLISPRLAHIGMLEFHRAAEAIKEGERCVLKALEEIRIATGKA